MAPSGQSTDAHLENRAASDLSLQCSLTGTVVAIRPYLGDISRQRNTCDTIQPTPDCRHIFKPTENGGEIHAYIGDEAIITWPFEAGAREGRCVRCFFAIQDVLDANAEAYENLFGVRPRIRASLHGGPVIVSACGDTKRSIVYYGDTMNTSARLEGEAKRLEKDLVISADLLQAIQMPSEITVGNPCEVTLRGHDSPTALFALSRRSSMPGTNAQSAEE
tara:strand:- start:12053 stop:12712 length:660 start_codon:yes stop_codon:yes gene_type:complete